MRGETGDTGDHQRDRTGRDAEAMRRALVLAASARRRTAPNPWVGCVLVDAAGRVVGEGATDVPGGPHAEIGALRAAGERARGATAYVTLEPCAHRGRTGPCTDALLAAGVTRVVSALLDPDPRVGGRGHEVLRSAGIDVSIGAAGVEAAALLAPYLHQRRTGRAFAVLKTAASLDGRTAAADGSSRWITGPEARADAHALRADSQAVVVGSGTALADRPALTVRDLPGGPTDPGPPARPPLRVLLDARGRVPVEGPLADTALAPTLVVTTRAAAGDRIDGWRRAGAVVATASPGPGGTGVDAAEVLALLAEEHGVIQALVEGGARLHGSLLQSGLVDRLVAYVAPVILGERGRAVFGLRGPDSIDGARAMGLVSVSPVGRDVRLDLDPGADREGSAGGGPGREQAA